jgi:hypothetical protein
MSLALFANWSVGVINGYKLKESGLPKDITYGTMGATIVAAWMRVLPTMNLRGLPQAAIAQKLAAFVIAAPLIVGTNFCVGHHLGKALRRLDDGI